jgi:LuxR family maltose regulon positive regulatory protein
MARVARAVALRDHGKLLAAEREAVEAERLQRCPDPEAGHLHALLVLADVRARRGRIDIAEHDLAAVRGRLAAFSDAGTLGAYADAVEATLARLRAAAATDVERPSDAELNVLRLLGTDLSQREIGAQLYLSVNTVKTHMRVLYRKLSVTSRDEAVGRATALGLLDPTDPPA